MRQVRRPVRAGELLHDSLGFRSRTHSERHVRRLLEERNEFFKRYVGQLDISEIDSPVVNVDGDCGVHGCLQKSEFLGNE